MNVMVMVVLYTQRAGFRFSAQKTPVSSEFFVGFLVPQNRHPINALGYILICHTVLIYLLELS
jgi:hypothetical protein